MGDFLICGQGFRSTHGGARRGSGLHNPQPPSQGLGSLVIRSSKGFQGGGFGEHRNQEPTGGLRKQTPDIWKHKVLKEPLYPQQGPFGGTPKPSLEGNSIEEAKWNAPSNQAVLSRYALEPHDAVPQKKNSSKPWRDILLREMLGEQSSRGPHHSGHELAERLTRGHAQKSGQIPERYQGQHEEGYGPTTKALQNYRKNTGGSIPMNMTGGRVGVVDVARRSSLSSFARAAAGYQSEPVSPRRDNAIEALPASASEGTHEYFEESSAPLQTSKIDRSGGRFPRISFSEKNRDLEVPNIECLSGQKDIAAAAAYASSLTQQYAQQVLQSQQQKQQKEGCKEYVEKKPLPQKRDEGTGWLTKLADKSSAPISGKQDSADTSMISAFALARTRCIVSNGEIFQYQQGRKVPVTYEKFQTLVAAADAQAAAEKLPVGGSVDSDLCIHTTKLSINRYPVDQSRNHYSDQPENESDEEKSSGDDDGESSSSDHEGDEGESEERQERGSQGTEDGDSASTLSKASAFKRKRRRSGRTKRKSSMKTAQRSRSHSISKPFDPGEDKRLAMKRLKESAAKISQSQDKLMEVEQAGQRTRKFQPVDPEEEKRKAAQRAAEYQKQKQSSKAIERPEEKIEAERRNKRKMSETMSQLEEAAKGQKRAEVYALNRIMRALEERKFEKYKEMMEEKSTDAASLGFKCETAPA